jgi:hypothetical protein
MKLVTDLLVNGPSDPLMMAGLILAVWVPICAVGLGALSLLTWLQLRFGSRRRSRPAVFVPPAEVRPLATRRYVSQGARGGGALGLARVTVAVAAVAAFTAFALAVNGPTLLAALQS